MVNLNDKVIDWKYLVTFQTQNIEGGTNKVIKIMKSVIKLL